MWTISLVPLSFAARLASFGISMPMISSAGETMRALMPRTRPLCWSPRLQRVVEIDAALRDDVRIRREPGLADVQERHDFGVAARHDVAREAAERRRARAAGVHDRRDPGVDAGEIGIDAGAVGALEDVRVEIDETGRDDLAGDVDRARSLGERDARRDARDLAILHRDVLDAIEPRGGVDDPSALEQQIEHGCPPWSG